MSQAKNPEWDPCREFAKKEGSKSTGDISKTTDNNRLVRSARIKNLAQAGLQEIDNVKEHLRSLLPLLSPEEIRRFYIPHHEAVLIELEENGHKDVAEYLKALFELDEETRRKAGPGTIVWKKPRLKDEVDFVNRLRHCLTAAEEAKRAKDPITQTTVLLNAALFFQSRSWEWWWVSESLYQSALLISESILDDHGQTVTSVRYLYGRFLFDQMEDPREAVQHLNAARETSEGKTWNASKILGQKQDSIFRECNTILHKAFLVLARKFNREQPDFAVQACEEALKRATDSGHNAHVIEALYELGRCYLRLDDVKAALQNFSKLLALAKRIPDPESICNAHMELAFAYKELDDHAGSEKHLRLFKAAATEFEIPYKLAQAHYYIGEHFLSRTRPDLATPHLENAFHLYSELGLNNEADRARIVAGISKGQETIHQYMDVLLRCGDGDQEAILKMCRWKNRRDVFWMRSRSDTTTDLSEDLPYEVSENTEKSSESF